MILVFSSGPISSTGFSGDGKWRNIICTEQIIKISNNIKNIDGAHYIPLIWKEDLTEELIKIFENNNIKPLILNSPIKKKSNRYIKPNLKLNLYYSCFTAINYAKRNGYSKIIKIRHDQDLNYLNLINDVKIISDNKIYNLAIDLVQPDSFLDFIFAGKIRPMRNFIHNCYLKNECHPDTSIDMFYKLSYSFSKRMPKFYLYKLYFFTIMNRNSIIHKIIDKHLDSLSSDLLDNFYWRGVIWNFSNTRYSKKHSNIYNYLEKNIKINPNIFPLYKYFKYIIIAFNKLINFFKFFKTS